MHDNAGYHGSAGKTRSGLQAGAAKKKGITRSAGRCYGEVGKTQFPGKMQFIFWGGVNRVIPK